MAVRKMHQTTVRFGADLWEALEEECADLGISVAQFVRESALARLLYLAGRRGDPGFERALEVAGGVVPQTGEGRVGASPAAQAEELDRSAAARADLSELWDQGRLAGRREDERREDADRRHDR